MSVKKAAVDLSEAISARILIEEMVIDSSYQGHVNPNLVKKIAAEWDDSAAGAIILNLRENNSYAVLDGQHRVLAAKIAHVKELYALVFIGKSHSEEARLFVQLNTKHNVRPFDRFHANMTAGEGMERAITKIAHDLGLKIADNPWDVKAVRCIVALEEIYTNYGPLQLRIVLGTLQSAFGSYEDRNAYSDTAVRGLTAFFARYPEAPVAKVIEKLSKYSPTTLRGMAYQRATGKSYWMEWGRVITNLFNSGHRTGSKYHLDMARWDHMKYSPAGKVKVVANARKSILYARSKNKGKK